MSDFEEKNAEEKTEVAEEGWTAVKGKGTTRRTEEEQNEMKAKAAKKRKKGQLVSILKIYHWQAYHQDMSYRRFNLSKDHR